MTATDQIFLPAITGWDLSIVVTGLPAGQGAITFLGKGRPAIHTNQKRLKPWRAAIITAAEKHMLRHHIAPIAKGAPVETDITIYVPRPKSAKPGSWPVTRYSSDLDHHARAVHDSLSEAHVFADDSQVVAFSARKTYPSTGAHALDEPGALIHVRVLPEAVA